MKFLPFTIATTSTVISLTHLFSSNIQNIDAMNTTKSASFSVKEGYDVFLDADFIYWSARLDGLQFAYSSTIDPSTTLTTNGVLPKGSFQYPSWHFDPGFKAGLGTIFKHDGWDLYMNYTHLNTSASNQKTYTPADHAISLIDHQITPSVVDGSNYLQSSKGSWWLHFNTLDLELGRDYYLSKFFTTRAFFGFKSTWQKQAFNGYFSLPGLVETSLNRRAVTQKFHQDNAFWGFGLRAGLNNAWNFTRDWSIFGNIAVSGLWCQFQVNTTFVEDAFIMSSGTVTTNYQNTMLFNNAKQFHSIKGVLELNMGLRFNYWFSQDRYRFRFEAGWEEQVWFDQNQFIPLSHSLINQQGDLVLQGLTLKVRFDF